MMRGFSQSRFQGSRFETEDINPSAYIVNLADCMLVLAVGFMVAMVTAYNVDISSNSVELDESQLEQVNPDTLSEDVTSSGSSYVERGVVYQDPATGNLYMVENTGSTDDTTTSQTADEGASTSAAQTSGDTGSAGQ